MIDRAKVIKGLNDICGFVVERMGFEQARNFLRTIDGVVELLKEQEEVKPTWSCGKPFCGACGLRIRSGWKFCSECGKPIAWEGR